MENSGFSKVPRRARCAACKAVFDPDLGRAAMPTSWYAATPNRAYGYVGVDWDSSEIKAADCSLMTAAAYGTPTAHHRLCRERDLLIGGVFAGKRVTIGEGDDEIKADHAMTSYGKSR